MNKKNLLQVFVLIFLTCISNLCLSQSNNVIIRPGGNGTSTPILFPTGDLALSLHITDKWNLFSYNQVRFAPNFPGVFADLYVLQAIYSWKHNISFYGGAWNYQNYYYNSKSPYTYSFARPLAYQEQGQFLGISVTNPIGKRLLLTTRFQLDHAFANYLVNRTAGLKPFDYWRFRPFIGITVPINHTTIIPKTFYITAGNDIFLGNRAPFLVENNAVIAAQYLFTKSINLAIQFNMEVDNSVGNQGPGGGPSYGSGPFTYFFQKYIQTILTININNQKKIPYKKIPYKNFNLQQF